MGGGRYQDGALASPFSLQYACAFKKVELVAAKRCAGGANDACSAMALRSLPGAVSPLPCDSRSGLKSVLYY
ncbi:hypothetical protein KCP74_01555 [Salmonella enterica subsp. enterica]|nr:hypothetical protein KCP74_01555 [Salmonella enterica subsp. enterica]